MNTAIGLLPTVMLLLWFSSCAAWSGTAPSFLDSASEQPSEAYSQRRLGPRSVVFNRDGQLVGFIDANGNIVDASGRVLGQVHVDGAVTNAQGVFIGEVNDRGEVIDSEGVYLGVIQDNGAAVSATQRVMGDVVQVAEGEKGLPLSPPPSGSPAPSAAARKNQRP